MVIIGIIAGIDVIMTMINTPMLSTLFDPPSVAPDMAVASTNHPISSNSVDDNTKKMIEMIVFRFHSILSVLLFKKIHVHIIIKNSSAHNQGILLMLSRSLNSVIKNKGTPANKVHKSTKNHPNICKRNDLKYFIEISLCDELL